MNKCPRYENEKLREMRSIQLLREIKDSFESHKCINSIQKNHAINYSRALSTAIRELERTAQEAPVQEQLILKEAEEIIATLSWRMGGINPKSALKFDKATKTILIDEDKLMDILQMITPTQKRRSLKIVKRK